MNKYAINYIKEINNGKKMINKLNSQLNEVRNERDYKDINNKMQDIRRAMVQAAEDLIMSLNNSIDLDNSLGYEGTGRKMSEIRKSLEA